ncbi:hypothetical protein [Blastococcus sp. KM273129]|uniref:hypothetical protein n=1 Tax=Blastococcus sp. KM273129 TaxID=2570315 RepID=UPI001F1E77B6|nr:hypothetical protein [Blastococcus sp. KM273129]MCF6733694.1 hypothetical protein [Blastococcus sp. KM273129]
MTLFDTAAPSDTLTASGDAGLGVIGTRQLVAVQTFDIARLTSHPVVLRPSSFIAVTGRGPRDSNESGKTSFNAAVALLLGDPEWRVSGGGVADVAQLLFEPDTAGVAAARFPAAQVGFIVGVFADPDDPAGTAHTVWMRIASTPKYLTVRHASGVHLVQGDTDQDRTWLAPKVWQSLRSDELGAQGYIDALYGRSPRCLAYVAARGKQRSGPSLLKMDAGAFRPEDIGAALVRLTGRSAALETEQAQRRELATQAAALAETKADHERHLGREETILADVRQRTRVREQLDEGQRFWRQHLARGLLDTLARQAALREELAVAQETLVEQQQAYTAARDAERALADDASVASRARAAQDAYEQADAEHSEAIRRESGLTTEAARLREDLIRLEARGALRSRLSVAEAEARLAEARQARARDEGRAHAAEQSVEALGEQVRDTEAGRGGDAGRCLAVLADAGVAAVGLLDAVEVDPAARGEWEPRLHPWRDAVCVHTDQVSHAVAELAAVPGAIVIGGSDDRTDPPDGLRAAPPWARAFLTELAARVTPGPGMVDTVIDAGLHVTVVGGFPHPTTGRTQLVAALRRRLDDAEAAHRAAAAAARRAGEREEIAAGALDAARAAAEHAQVSARLRQVEEEQLPAAGRRVQQRAERRSVLEDAYTRARSEVTALEAARAGAEAARRSAEGNLTAARSAVAEIQRSLDGLGLDYWLAEFGGSDRDARDALNWDDGPLRWEDGHARPTGPQDPAREWERRTRDTLRNRANDRLTAIVTLLDIDRSSGAGAPTAEITEAVRQREHLADSAGTRLGRDEIGFSGLAQAIDAWLARYADRDLLASEQIRTARAQREQEITFAEEKLAGMQSGLDNIQDSLEQRIEGNLAAISEALNRLNLSAQGFGAQLDWEVLRPAAAEDAWTWRVVPKWRRSPGGRMLRYDNATNSAQEKLFSVHLVLAALLASPHPQGRVLILDELGDSLGDEHRRDVLTAVAAVAAEYGITVLGTCQDAVMPDAAAYCGEVLYFSYPSKAEALNQPTRMFGFDEHRARVELTAEALLAGRPWS